MYEIEFTSTALQDLTALRKFEQQTIIDEIETQLQYQPEAAARNRKKLRPNNVANWELRIGKFRVFYNVDIKRHNVSIEAVGFKVGNALFIRGKQRFL